MLVYRLNKYIDPSNISTVFDNTIDLPRIPTILMDDVEIIWNHDKKLSIVFHYADTDVYYFIVEDPFHDEVDYHLLRLEVFQDPLDHHCDYYAKPLLARFLGRFERRLYTRRKLEDIISSISYTPTDIEYHVELLYELEQTYVNDLCDRQLLQKIKEESHNIVQAEKDYRPNGTGFEKAKEQFQETILLSSIMDGMGMSASHSQKNLLPADSK